MSSFKASSASGKLLAEEKKRVTFFGLPLSFTKYLLTEKKFILQKGFFTRTEDEILLYRVLDLSMKKTLFQRMFGLGSIMLSAQDNSLPELEIKNIKNPEEFRDILSEQIESEKSRLQVRRGEYVGSGGAGHGGHGHPHDHDHDFDMHDHQHDDMHDHDNSDFHDNY